ncbi:hypothetical protein D0864_12696 [Hortaea werneckii]|uniref:Core Histone H2A/H2B/H3 domain-containing protein n=1 Tax=Hortaea werneckii TaxID=91943 RepID=A0A3M7DFX0_HORWE|nr:hypothetical protein D0864_12696 [Hortaea werneckii]
MAGRAVKSKRARVIFGPVTRPPPKKELGIAHRKHQRASVSMTNNRRKRLYKSGGKSENGKYYPSGRSKHLAASALRRPARYQKSTDDSVPELAFQHRIREVVKGFLNDVRFQDYPMGALQEAAEAYMERIFDSRHANHTKIQKKDIVVLFDFLRSWGVMR